MAAKDDYGLVSDDELNDLIEQFTLQKEPGPPTS